MKSKNCVISKIVSLNLRMAYAWKEENGEVTASEIDGDNGWNKRSGIVLDFIRNSRADIFCFQEAQPIVVEYLRDALPEYGFCGTGRLKGLEPQDEFASIAYSKERYELLESKTFWLSPTPEIPESTFEGQYYNIPRICTKAKFRNKSTGESFYVYNTHFCLYENIIKQEYEMLEADIAKNSELCFLCGDLNTTPDKLIGEYNKVLCDLTAALPYTFNAFGKAQKKIDYILSNRKLESRAYISEIIENGVYISDHFPVTVEFAE